MVVIILISTEGKTAMAKKRLLTDAELRRLWAKVWREFRETMGWSKTTAADVLDLPIWTIHNWESGKALPTLRILSHVYIKTSVNLTDLFFRSIERPLNLHTIETGSQFYVPGIYKSTCCSVLKSAESGEVAQICDKCAKPTTWELIVRKEFKEPDEKE